MRFTYQSGAQPLEGYTILNGIHRGGFGEVYFARSDGGKDVALKLLHEEDQETELRGVSQCLNLKHPNLVNIFDLKTDVDGDHWIVMEYVSGSNLEDVLASFPDGLPMSEVRDWLSGIVAGVSHLHERGIIHRDLKPANIYRENSVVKVGDVGLSKLLDSETRRRHTQSVGTVYYMAPEVAQGKYGPEVDVYSLGIVLYEMMTGKLPFNGETTAEILMKHLTTQPNLAPIPRPFKSVIAHALEKDPRQRTPSVQQLELEFLRAFQSSEAASTEGSSASRDSTAQKKTFDEQHGTSSQSDDSFSSARRWKPFPKTTRTGICVIGVLSGLLAIGLMKAGVSRIGPPLSLGRLSVALVIPVIGICYAIRSLTRNRIPPRSNRKASSFQAVTTPAKPVEVPKSRVERRVFPESSNAFGIVPMLGNSMSRAAMIAAIIAAGVFLLMSPPLRTKVFPAEENLVLFASVSILGSWLILMSRAMTGRVRLSQRQRSLVQITTGALIGAAAFGLQEFLNIHVPASVYTVKAVFRSLGSPLVAPGLNPTLLGYIVFFAGWNLLRREPRELEFGCFKRLSLRHTMKSVIIAFVVSWMFAFPQWYALLWAATISVTIQLASTRSPNPLIVGGR